MRVYEWAPDSPERFFIDLDQVQAMGATHNGVRVVMMFNSTDVHLTFPTTPERILMRPHIEVVMGYNADEDAQKAAYAALHDIRQGRTDEEFQADQYAIQYGWFQELLDEWQNK